MSSPPTGPTSTRSAWLERLVLPVAVAALTVCWLALWVRWVAAAGNFGGSPTVPAWVMLAALVVSAWVTRRALGRARHNYDLQQPQRLIGFGGLAAVVLILWITFGTHFPFGYFMHLTEWGRVVSPEALALVVAALLWWRGIRIGRNDDMHESAQREFFGGTLALALLFIANRIAPHLSTIDVFWPTLIFFALGLASMAVAGLEGERRRQKESTGSNVGTSRHWLITVCAIIGLILLGGVAVAGVTVPESVAALTHILDAVGTLLLVGVGLILYYIISLLMPVLDLLARAILPLLQMLTGLANFPTFTLPFTPEEIEAAAAQIARTTPFRLFEILAVLSLIVLVFLLAVRRFRLLSNPGNSDEDRESILTRELLWSQLRSLFARRGAATPSVPPPFVALSGAPDDPRLVVRRAYQSMLAWAEARQLARAPGQTPQVYAGWLGRKFPAADHDLQALTLAYIRARYGGEVAAADAHRAQTAIDQILAIRIE